MVLHNTNARTAPGAASASSWLTMPPNECPKTMAGPANPSRTVSRGSAHCAIVWGPLSGGEAPNPARSTTTQVYESLKSSATSVQKPPEQPKPCTKSMVGPTPERVLCNGTARGAVAALI